MRYIRYAHLVVAIEVFIVEGGACESNNLLKFD